MTKQRKFREADYEATEKTQITLGEALPEEHLARFIVRVVSLLDLSEIYAGYSERGGMAYAPEVLLGLLLYGYATGTFSSRKIERGTYETIPQMEKRLQQEIDELFALAEQADSESAVDLDMDNEIGRRRQKLASLAQAKAILDERARQRHTEA
jgi:hypothetical protein